MPDYILRPYFQAYQEMDSIYEELAQNPLMQTALKEFELEALEEARNCICLFKEDDKFLSENDFDAMDMSRKVHFIELLGDAGINRVTMNLNQPSMTFRLDSLFVNFKACTLLSILDRIKRTVKERPVFMSEDALVTLQYPKEGMAGAFKYEAFLGCFFCWMLFDEYIEDRAGVQIVKI